MLSPRGLYTIRYMKWEVIRTFSLLSYGNVITKFYTFWIEMVLVIQSDNDTLRVNLFKYWYTGGYVAHPILRLICCGVIILIILWRLFPPVSLASHLTEICRNFFNIPGWPVFCKKSVYLYLDLVPIVYKQGSITSQPPLVQQALMFATLWQTQYQVFCLPHNCLW